MKDRDWLLNPRLPQVADRALPPWLSAGVLLFFLSPLAAWAIAVLPGGHRNWAIVVWPVGWMASVTLLLGGTFYTRVGQKGVST